ncbi:guanine nucleotide exchange factor DBS-like [Oscarella lobularis]|uniref:guanine nucleotide exchange factor DBS-like n=1 Tax=Oscarella lobularis TaxID=121494 RepID=UPI003313ADB4
MKQLEQLMDVKDFEDKVQQVLLWIEKETTGCLVDGTSSQNGNFSARGCCNSRESRTIDSASETGNQSRILCREAGVVTLDLQWKQFSVRLLHWKSRLTKAVSFFEKADEFNQFLVKGVESFQSVALESTVEGMEKLLSEHGKRTATLKDITKSTMNEGSALLDRLKHPGKELQFGDGSSDGETIRVNYYLSVGFLGSFLTELQDRSEQLDDMWTARGRALQQALELRKFEGNYRDVSVSVEAVAASMETSALEIGPSVAALMLLQEQHDSLEADAKAVVTKMARLKLAKPW